MSRSLLKPMDEDSFMQLTLLANSIAIFEIVLRMEKPGSDRRRAYADILKRLRRCERSIEGHLEERTLDASKEFYSDMEAAVVKFRKSFKEDL